MLRRTLPDRKVLEQAEALSDKYAQLAFTEPGLLQGRLSALSLGSLAGMPVRVVCNGVSWACVPVALEGEFVTFDCVLSPALIGQDVHVTVEDAASSHVLASTLLKPRKAVRNHHGLSAADVFDSNAAPLWSIPWISFDGARVVLSGACLPPHGDPGALSVCQEDGLSVSLEYGMLAPEFGAHYWYWPNASKSGLRITIDLARSRQLPVPLSVKLKFHYECELGEADWPDRGRVWIPHDLASFANFPSDETQLNRVQTWSTDTTVAFTGYDAFRVFESLAKLHDVRDRPGLTVLDWGCGHGRLTRHFIRNWPKSRIVGLDIDHENIAWCQKNLSGGEFVPGPLWPPTRLATRSMDLVVGLSVMTHLTRDAQTAWLAEIARVMRLEGIVILTFGSEAAAAFSSLHHGYDYWRTFQETGFDDSQHDPALESKIDDPTYYRTTHQLTSQVRREWGKTFEIAGLYRQAFGYQDAAILRLRS